MNINGYLGVSNFESDFSNWGGYSNELEDMLPGYSEEYEIRYREDGYCESKYASYKKRYGAAA